MSKLSSKQRAALPKSDFAVPGKAPASGSYPVPDASHARNALARVAQHGSPAEKAAVRAKVHAKFPGIGNDHKSATVSHGSMTDEEHNSRFNKGLKGTGSHPVNCDL